MSAAAARGGGGGRGLLALEAGEQLDDLLADPVEVGAELLQHLGGDALALADQAEQDVLGADVGVAELQRLAQGQLEHLLGARREGDVAAGRLLALADDLLDLGAHGLERDVEALERLGGDSFALVDQAEQDVLGPDVVVGEHAGLFLGQHNHPTGPVSKPLEHAHRSWKQWGPPHRGVGRARHLVQPRCQPTSFPTRTPGDPLRANRPPGPDSVRGFERGAYVGGDPAAVGDGEPVGTGPVADLPGAGARCGRRGLAATPRRPPPTLRPWPM